MALRCASATFIAWVMAVCTHAPRVTSESDRLVPSTSASSLASSPRHIDELGADEGVAAVQERQHEPQQQQLQQHHFLTHTMNTLLRGNTHKQFQPGVPLDRSRVGMEAAMQTIHAPPPPATPSSPPPPSPPHASWRRVHIDNSNPRRQTSPRPDGSTVVNSHDPFLLWHNGTFFMWGIVQPDCVGSPLCKGDPHHCGWGPNTFALHTSTDFISWRHHTDDILADGSGRPGMYCLPGTPGCTPTGACGAFLPKVIFNRKTGLFVLWWTCATCSVATSSSPFGPWTVSSYNVTYSDGKPVCHGSINFFVDEATAEGYLVKNWYNESAHEVVSIERLTPDYLGSAANGTAVAFNATTSTSSGLVGVIGSENAFIVRSPMSTGSPLYFLVEPSLCCFCPWGAGAAVFTASHPLGPWTRRARGWNGDWRPCRGYCPLATNHSAIVPVQPAAVVALPARLVTTERPRGSHRSNDAAQVGHELTSSPPLWVMMGDRWLSAPDSLKSNDFTVFLPLAFDAVGQLVDNAWHNGTAADNWAMEIEVLS